MVSQLEKDIVQRIREKLYQWAHDARELHDMADLSEKTAFANISYELLDLITRMSASATAMTPEQFGRLCERHLQRRKKDWEKEQMEQER